MPHASRQFWNSFVATLAGRSRSARNKSTRRFSAVAAVERLEPRALLAGVVNVTFASGTLTITGVDDLTPAGFAGGLNDQSVSLVGSAAGLVTVSGLAGTTVNNGGTFAGVTAIKLDMKLGNDSVQLQSVFIFGSLTYLGGDGDNRITFNAGTQSFSSISVTNGEGLDRFEIIGSDLAVSGAVTISNGDGDDIETLGSLATDDVYFGSLKITSGDGAGQITSLGNSLAVIGTTQIITGDGTSELTLTPAILTLGSTLSMTNGSDFNTVEIGKAGASNNAAGITLQNGNGGSHTTLRGTYLGAITITNSAGKDELDLESLTVTGNVTVSNGTGGSDSDFKGAIAVTGSLSITNTSGNDKVGINSTGWTSLNVTGALSIANGNGASVVTLAPTTTARVGGALSLTNGIGDTQLALQATTSFTVVGTTTITNGEGDDTLILGNTPSNDAFKAVTINFGVGDSSTEFRGKEVIDGVLSLLGGTGVHLVQVNKPLTTKGATFNLQGVGQGNLPSVLIAVTQPLTVTGNLSITTNAGKDRLLFTNTLLVTGTTTLSTGTGDDEILFNGTGSSLTGTVSITTGTGNDDVRFLNGQTVTGATTVTTGTGNDRVDIDQTTFKGTVGLTMGGGNDIVNIEQTNDGFKSRFEKAVTITGDAGDDVINIGLANDANDFAEFLATLTVKGGTGFDTIRYKNAALGGTRTNTFFSAPAITEFEILE